MIRFLSPVLALALACGSLVSCSSFKNSATGKKAVDSKSIAKINPLGIRNLRFQPEKLKGFKLPSFGKKLDASKSIAKLNPLGIRNLRFQPEKLKGFKFPSFGRKSTPPIVEVQKEVPNQVVAKAEADALAWKQKTQKALIPKDFEASDLDIDGQIPSYGILPSLSPGDRTSIDDLDEAAPLPADVLNLPEIPSMRPINRIPDLSSIPGYLKPAGPVPEIKKGQ